MSDYEIQRERAKQVVEELEANVFIGDLGTDPILLLDALSNMELELVPVETPK